MSHNFYLPVESLLSQYKKGLIVRWELNETGLKRKLRLIFTTDRDDFYGTETFVIALIWKDRPIIRQAYLIKEPYSAKNIKDGLDALYAWAKDFILNYDDLTPSQKHRIKDYKYLDCEHARMKSIRVRMPLNNDTKKYRLVWKTVIVELQNTK